MALISSISMLPNNIPVLDQNNNFTPAWYIFWQQIYLRNGGAIAQSNNDLNLGQLDDAGIEEIKASVYALSDESQASIKYSDIQQELYAIRDQAAMLSATVQSLIDDLNNSPSAQPGYDYNPSAVSISGGLVDGVAIGSTNPAAGKFTDVTNGNAAALIKTSVSLNNGAGAQLGTLINSPLSGPPTKWATVNDNGTIRYSPLW